MMLIVGILMIAGGGYWRFQLRKYEFEHRTGGGVVTFDTFGGSIKHKSKLNMSGWLIGLGVLVTVIGIMWAASGQ